MFRSAKSDNSTIPAYFGAAPTTEEVGFAEAFQAGFDEMFLLDAATGAVRDFSDRFNSFKDQLGDNTIPYLDLKGAGYIIDKFEGNPDAGQFLHPEERGAYDRVAEMMDTMNAEDDQSPTMRGLWDQTRSEMLEADRAAKEVSEKQGGFGKFAGSMAGGMAGWLAAAGDDPVRALSLMAGGVGSSFARRIVTEMGVNAAVEGLEQFTTIEDNRKLVGLEKDWKEKLTSAALGGLFAGGFRAGFVEVPSAVAGAVSKRLDINDILDDALSRLPEDKQLELLTAMPQTPTVRAAVDEVQRNQKLAEADPFPKTNEGSVASMASVVSRGADEAPLMDRLRYGVSIPAIRGALPEMPEVTTTFDDSPLKFAEATEQAKVVDLDIQINDTVDARTATEIQIKATEDRLLEIENAPQIALAAEIDPEIRAKLAELEAIDETALSKRNQKKVQARKDEALDTLGRAEEVRTERMDAAQAEKKSLEGQRAELQRKERALKSRRGKAVKKAERKIEQRQARPDQKTVDEVTLNPYEPHPALANSIAAPRALSDVFDPYSYRGRGVAEAAKELTEETAVKVDALEARDVPEEIDGMVDFGDGPVPADMEIPVGVRDGDVEVMTARELAEDLAEDARLLEVLEACKI